MIQKIVLALLLASSAALAIEDADGSLAKFSADDRAALAKALDISFFDGPTARLRDVKMASSRQVCGWANLKNVSGGYTGYRLFAADLKDPYAAAMKRTAGQVSDDDGDLGALRKVCIETRHLDK